MTRIGGSALGIAGPRQQLNNCAFLLGTKGPKARKHSSILTLPPMNAGLVPKTASPVLMKMDDEEYITTQVQLQLLASIVLTLDLEGFIARINRAETLVPIIDPTLYIKGGAKLAQIKELAEAIQHVQIVARNHE